MVILLPPVKSFGEEFGQAIGGGLGQGFQQGREESRKMAELARENAEIKKSTGIDLSGQTDPEMRKASFIEQLRQRQEPQAKPLNALQEAQKRLAEAKIGQVEGESDFGDKGYDIMKENFGEKFANIWKSSPKGAKTKLEDAAFQSLARGENIKDLLDKVKSSGIPQETSADIESNEIPQMKNGKISKDFKWPDYSKRPMGYNQKEWNDEKKEWRKENAPIFQDITKKVNNLKGDLLSTKKLVSLNESKKLPQDENFERYLINPETGDFYGIAQLAGLKSPEAQEWSKVIARFQNRAKDAFGSRVTNFDLQSYMQQFPGLLNTYEGRKRILKMLDINFKLDDLHAKALQKVYQKYGLSEIPQEEAEKLAQEFISDETDKLHNQFLGLDEQNQSDTSQKGLSGRMVDVMGPDGKEYEIDEREVDQLPEGYRVK